MIDRELYLPDVLDRAIPQRLAAAGVPDDIEFATKPALATGMLARALRAGVPARWVAGDEVYGADPGLRAELRGPPARLRAWPSAATAASRPRPARSAPTSWPPGCRDGPGSGSRPDPGAKGQRFYDWAWIDHTDPARCTDRRSARHPVLVAADPPPPRHR